MNKNHFSPLSRNTATPDNNITEVNVNVNNHNHNNNMNNLPESLHMSHPNHINTPNFANLSANQPGQSISPGQPSSHIINNQSNLMPLSSMAQPQNVNGLSSSFLSGNLSGNPYLSSSQTVSGTNVQSLQTTGTTSPLNLSTNMNIPVSLNSLGSITPIDGSSSGISGSSSAPGSGNTSGNNLKFETMQTGKEVTINNLNNINGVSPITPVVSTSSAASAAAAAASASAAVTINTSSTSNITNLMPLKTSSVGSALSPPLNLTNVNVNIPTSTTINSSLAAGLPTVSLAEGLSSASSSALGPGNSALNGLPLPPFGNFPPGLNSGPNSEGGPRPPGPFPMGVPGPLGPLPGGPPFLPAMPFGDQR